VHHFNIALQNIRSAHDFLENVCAQLILRYQLDYHSLPEDALKDSGFLSELLAKAAQQRPESAVVVLVDALDEAEDVPLRDGHNRLYLPQSLPDGVFFVVTARELDNERLLVDRARVIYLKDTDPKNESDVRLYVENFLETHRTDMGPRLAEWGLGDRAFIGVLTRKSQGNFMYVKHVLEDICAGRLTRATLDDIAQLPAGLRAYYQRHWDRMRDQDRDRFETIYEPVVCQLAVAQEPVSVAQLHEWLPQLTPPRIRDWRQFLNEERKEQVSYYRIYHTSFQEFLRDEVGLVKYHQNVVDTALGKIPGFLSGPNG
jgi:serine/threonine-protein kinase